MSLLQKHVYQWLWNIPEHQNLTGLVWDTEWPTLLLEIRTVTKKHHCLQLELSSELWAWGQAQGRHSINTCWLAASDDTKMKYKGKIKYIKALIRPIARLSLRLSWFLLCPGHVGSVLIFMASISLMCYLCHLLQGSPHLPFPFSTLFQVLIIANRALWKCVHENSNASLIINLILLGLSTLLT